MQKISLEALARQQMKLAATAAGRHTADTVFGGHESAAPGRDRHDRGRSPWRARDSGEATVLILHGRVRLAAADLSGGGSGDLLIMPDNRHSLEALEDSAVLLTVAKL